MENRKTLLSFLLIAVLAVLFAFVAVTAPLSLAQAEGEEETPVMIFETVVTTTATEAEPGIFREIREGDTFTIRYKLIRNDGMADAIFTPSYDREAFALTAFSVDTNTWELFNSYRYTDVDPVTGDKSYRYLTAAEHIAAYNAALAAQEEPQTARLSFIVSYPVPEDAVGVLSDRFIEVTYTALADMSSATLQDVDFSFGFDTETYEGRQYTQADTDGEDLMELLIKRGEDEGGDPITEALGANDYSFSVLAEIALAFEEDQAIALRYDELSGDFYFDPADIRYTYVRPTGTPNPYLADGGEVTAYTFYTKDPTTGEYTLMDGYPTEPDLENVYVRLTLKGTNLYQGITTNYVHIAVTPMYIDTPALSLNYDEEEVLLDEESMTLAGGSITYGTTLTLSEIVNNLPVAFPLEDADFYSVYFEALNEEGDAYVESVDPITTNHLPVNSYRVRIAVDDPTHTAFRNAYDPFATEIVITLTVTPAPLTLQAYVYDAQAEVNKTAYTVKYGAAAPACDYQVTGILSGDTEVITVTASSAYQQYTSGVGAYSVTCVYELLSQNYFVESNEGATITVEAKPLTLQIEYSRDIAQFFFNGIVNNDIVTVRYLVDGVAVDANSYTATIVDYERGETVIYAAVEPLDNDNYAMTSEALALVHRITFAANAGEDAVSDMPDTLYVFHGSRAEEAPSLTPLRDKYQFLYWKKSGEEAFSFAETDVTADVALLAEWERLIYTFRFKAVGRIADADPEVTYLAWNEEQGAFLPSTVEADVEYLKGTAIPNSVNIRFFGLLNWYACDPALGDPTLAMTMDPSMSLEENPDAYYLAIMIFHIGVGDVDGDGFVSLNDSMTMKRVLADCSLTPFDEESVLWHKLITGGTITGDYFPALWDVNEDGRSDIRDVTALRQALAVGYGFVVSEEITVDDVKFHSAHVERDPVQAANDLDEIGAAIFAGKTVLVKADVSAEIPVEVVYDGNVTVDLSGKTFSAESLSITATGRIVIRNGVLDVETITLTAPGGVFIRNVYDGEEKELWTDGSQTEYSKITD